MTCRTNKPKHKAPGAQQQNRIAKAAADLDPLAIFNLLSSRELCEVMEQHLPAHRRERHFPPQVTLAMFIGQALSEEGSLQRAVDQWAVRGARAGAANLSTHTGAYCRASQRLSLDLVRALCEQVGAQLHAAAESAWRWRGRPVKLIDGTGLSMPDTQANRARYPQPASQAPGVGFPQARMVGVTCLATGAVLAVALGRYAGKGQGELSLMRALDGAFDAGDVVLGDALYCSYFTIAQLQARGIDLVCERHGSRRSDFRRGHRLGARDHVIEWKKPVTCPAWMSREQYEAAPAVLRVREAKVGGRVLVTTLCSSNDVAKGELEQLYKQRWQVELDLRNIKTTMGMEVLRCKTPEAIDKEIWVHLLAYNLIRVLMAQAAERAGTLPRLISFKHTLALWSAWRASERQAQSDDDLEVLFDLMAQRRVGRRPGRREPRACKRRPRRTKWLKEPRELARARLCKTGEVL